MPPNSVENLLTALWGRLLLLMNGDLAPFSGLSHRAGEKLWLSKDCFGQGLEHGTEMLLCAITPTFERDENESECLVKSST